MILEYDKVLEILKKYNQDDFHIRHGEVVSGVMRYFAKEYDPEREDFWATVGLLHDIDFEMYPDEHCIKAEELLRENGYDEEFIHGVVCHAYGICEGLEKKPEHIMEKILFATDELTGDDFHIRHGEVVSGVMRYFAKDYDPEREDFWATVGLLHDIDFEMYPDEHCVKAEELLRENGYDEEFIHAVVCHAYGILEGLEKKPEHIMEKILFATDELTGLIGAVAIMRPCDNKTF